MNEKGFFETEVEAALEVLRKGGVILYPTDTIWGLGCDATHAEAIKKIYDIKQREDTKSLIILVADERQILQYVAAPELGIFEFMEAQTRPTTFIFENAIGLPENLVAQDGSIAIRLVKDDFCRHLIRRLGKPIVSTSANISGKASPQNFGEVAEEIQKKVDHVVQWRKEERGTSQPSRIIKWNQDGSHQIIRP